MDPALALTLALLLAAAISAGVVAASVAASPTPAPSPRPAAAPTPPAPPLYLHSLPTLGSAIGTRAEAAARCAAAWATASAGPPCRLHTPVLTYAEDSIHFLAGRYGVPREARVLGPSGAVIAAAWSDFARQPPVLVSSLKDAGVAPSGSWWTGRFMFFKDEAAPARCGEWREGGLGWVGDSAALDSAAIDAGIAPCDAVRDLVCLCM